MMNIAYDLDVELGSALAQVKLENKTLADLTVNGLIEHLSSRDIAPGSRCSGRRVSSARLRLRSQAANQPKKS